MSVQDHHLNVNANHGKDPLDFSLPLTPTAASNVVFARFSPGFPFQIVRISLYGSAFTTVSSVDAGIAPTAGGTFTSALSAAIVPSNDTEVAGVLSATKANTYTRNSTSQLICRYTATGSPSAANAYITIVIRPRPLDGEIL